jgi:hypothetical protein
MIGTNFVVLSCDPILKWGCAKEFDPWDGWGELNRGQKVISAGMSLLSPVICKDFDNDHPTTISFRPWSYNVFYFWNTVIFAVISTSATIFINLLSCFGAISLRKLDLPLLTFRQVNQIIGNLNQTLKVNETFQVQHSPIYSKCSYQHAIVEKVFLDTPPKNNN